jgi:hypothetical protein
MSDSVIGTVGISSAEERNERFRERHGGRVVRGRNKCGILQAARRVCPPREKQTDASASSATGVSSAGARNVPFSERHSGLVVGGRKKRAI